MEKLYKRLQKVHENYLEFFIRPVLEGQIRHIEACFKRNHREGTYFAKIMRGRIREPSYCVGFNYIFPIEFKNKIELIGFLEKELMKFGESLKERKKLAYQDFKRVDEKFGKYYDLIFKINKNNQYETLEKLCGKNAKERFKKLSKNIVLDTLETTEPLDKIMNPLEKVDGEYKGWEIEKSDGKLIIFTDRTIISRNYEKKPVTVNIKRRGGYISGSSWSKLGYSIFESDKRELVKRVKSLLGKRANFKKGRTRKTRETMC